METPVDELELEDGVVRVADMPEKFITLGELAHAQQSYPWNSGNPGMELVWKLLPTTARHMAQTGFW